MEKLKDDNKVIEERLNNSLFVMEWDFIKLAFALVKEIEEGNDAMTSGVIMGRFIQKIKDLDKSGFCVITKDELNTLRSTEFKEIY